jgi:hypothetical protein
MKKLLLAALLVAVMCGVALGAYVPLSMKILDNE